jgi:VWFA-related protein
MMAILSLLALSLPSQDVLQFRVGVRRVHVDVFVSRNGASVTDLKADDFEVEDEGKRQAVELVDTASIPRTVALLLDESGSISGRTRELLAGTARDFATRLRPEDELTVLGFAERVSRREPLRVDPTRIERTAYEIRGGGWTALNDALFLTMTYLRNARGRPFLVVLSDGMDNASWIREEVVIRAVRESEVVVYAVKARATRESSRPEGTLVPGGAGAESSATLDEITRLSGGRSVEASRPEAVASAFEKILSEVSARYVLTFSPPEQAEVGWHQLRVRVRGAGDVDVRARGAYYLPPQN